MQELTPGPVITFHTTTGRESPWYGVSERPAWRNAMPKSLKERIPASKGKAGQGESFPVLAQQFFSIRKRNSKAGAIFELAMEAHPNVLGQASQIVMAVKVVFQSRQIDSAVGTITDGFTKHGEEVKAFCGRMHGAAPPTLQGRRAAEGQMDGTKTKGSTCGSFYELPSVHCNSLGTGKKKSACWRKAHHNFLLCKYNAIHLSSFFHVFLIGFRLLPKRVTQKNEKPLLEACLITPVLEKKHAVGMKILFRGWSQKGLRGSKECRGLIQLTGIICPGGPSSHGAVEWLRVPPQ